MARRYNFARWPRGRVRQIGNRIFGLPPGRTKRGTPVNPRFAYDTARGSFYSNPHNRGTWFGRSHKLDVRVLMITVPQNFRITSDGEVHFRGQRIGWNIKKNKNPPARLRTYPASHKISAQDLQTPEFSPDESYVAELLRKSPGYSLVDVYRWGDRLAYVFRGRGGHTFTVTR